MKKLLNYIIPKYAYIPLLLAMLMNFIAYYCTPLITNSMTHYDASVFVDNNIPFFPVFIVFYIFAFIQWVVGYIMIARESKSVCYYVIFADIVAKIMCLFFFVVFPTTIERPVVSSDNLLLSLTNFIYQLDAPINLFPSIHCLESWICFRGSLHLKKVPRWYKYFMFITTVLVCLSTVFVKQHVIVDVIGGIMVAEIGLMIMKKFYGHRTFMKSKFPFFF